MFAKYDPKGTGSLNVHNFVLQLMSPEQRPDPWFRDRPTYEFHVLNRAPMKKARPLPIRCRKRVPLRIMRVDPVVENNARGSSSLSAQMTNVAVIPDAILLSALGLTLPAGTRCIFAGSYEGRVLAIGQMDIPAVRNRLQGQARSKV